MIKIIYFLILTSSDGGVAVFPEPFDTEQACQKVGDKWQNWRRGYECLPYEDKEP